MCCRLLSVVALLIGCCLATGCRHCRSSSDYCGPVYEDGRGYGFLERRGSILGNGPLAVTQGPPILTAPPVEMVPAPAPAEAIAPEAAPAPTR